MKLTLEHVDPQKSDLPFQKLSYLEMAEKLDPRLAPLLWEELSAGNRIWEAGKGFPDTESLYVSLSRPFKKIHLIPEGVEFFEEKDPHYNDACYVTEGPVPQALCAPFKE